MKYRLFFLLFGVIVLFFISCNTEFDKIKLPAYSPTVAMPLFEASLKLDDVIKPSETVVFQEDGAIHLVFSEDSLFSVVVADLVNIPDQQAIMSSYELGQISIADFNFASSVTLQTLSASMDAVTRAYLEAANGSSTFPFPAFSSEGNTIIAIPPLNNLEYANIATGNLKLSITNNFPADIENVHLVLKNNDNSVVFDENIPLIAANNLVNINISLNGKYISKDMSIELQSFSSPGTSTPVLIDLTDKLEFSFSCENLIIESGSAIIEPQIFSSTNSNIDLSVDAGYQLSQIDLKSTIINYSISSTIQLDFMLRISFPNTLSKTSGEAVIAEIPISYNGGGAPLIGTIDLSNTSTILTPANVVPIEYELEILNSPGSPVIFNSTDKMDIEIQLGDIKYSLIKGFFGKNSIVFDPELIDFGADFFNDIEGDFTLTDPIMNITYSNSIGLPIAVALQINGKDKDGNAQALNYLNAQGNDTIYFAYPDVVGETVNDQFQISKETSDIVELLALPPVSIEYGGAVVSNTFGDGSPNFVTDTSQIVFGIEMDLPLNLSINNLKFEQTTDVDLSSELKDFNDLIESANIFLNIQNGFPLTMDIQLYFMDTITNQALDNIVLESILAAAVDASGKVSTPTSSNLDIAIDQTTFDNMLMSNAIKISATVSTTNHGQQSVKLYSNYELRVALGLQLHLKID